MGCFIMGGQTVVGLDNANVTGCLGVLVHVAVKYGLGVIRFG